MKCSIPAQAGGKPDACDTVPNPPLAARRFAPYSRDSRAACPSLRSVDVPARHTRIRPATLRRGRCGGHAPRRLAARNEPRVGQAAPVRTARPVADRVRRANWATDLRHAWKCRVDVPVIGLPSRRRDQPGGGNRAASRESRDMAVAAKDRLTRDLGRHPRVRGQPRRSSCRRGRVQEGSAPAWWTSASRSGHNTA